MELWRDPCEFDVHLEEDDSPAKMTLNKTSAVCSEQKPEQGPSLDSEIEACPFHLRKAFNHKMHTAYQRDTDVCTLTPGHTHVVTSLDSVSRCQRIGPCNVIPPCNPKPS